MLRIILCFRAGRGRQVRSGLCEERDPQVQPSLAETVPLQALREGKSSGVFALEEDNKLAVVCVRKEIHRYRLHWQKQLPFRRLEEVNHLVFSRWKRMTSSQWFV